MLLRGEGRGFFSFFVVESWQGMRVEHFGRLDTQGLRVGMELDLRVEVELIEWMLGDVAVLAGVGEMAFREPYRAL